MKAKHPARHVQRAQRVPRSVLLPGIPHPLLTDVIAIGTVMPQALTTKVRPLMPGYSVGLLGADTGTLGCFVSKTSEPNVPLILSNSHVLAQTGVATPGTPVVQPGPNDGGLTADSVATLAESVPFDFSAGYNNLCDAAIATLSPGVAVSNVIPTIGQPKSEAPIPSLQVGTQIQKTGRTSGYTIGIVQDIHFQTMMFYPEPGGGSGNAGFHEQVLCSHYSSSGDSGSLVCDMTGAAVGLHWAGSSSASIFSPIQFVFQQLKLQLWHS